MINGSHVDDSSLVGESHHPVAGRADLVGSGSFVNPVGVIEVGPDDHLRIRESSVVIDPNGRRQLARSVVDRVSSEVLQTQATSV